MKKLKEIMEEKICRLAEISEKLDHMGEAINVLIECLCGEPQTVDDAEDNDDTDYEDEEVE